MESPDLTSAWLNYRDLRYFHAVAQEGSMRRASEKLRTSQPVDLRAGDRTVAAW